MFVFDMCYILNVTLNVSYIYSSKAVFICTNDTRHGSNLLPSVSNFARKLSLALVFISNCTVCASVRTNLHFCTFQDNGISMKGAIIQYNTVYSCMCKLLYGLCVCTGGLPTSFSMRGSRKFCQWGGGGGGVQQL